jgi:hypothetical protein
MQGCAVFLGRGSAARFRLPSESLPGKRGRRDGIGYPPAAKWLRFRPSTDKKRRVFRVFLPDGTGGAIKV